MTIRRLLIPASIFLLAAAACVMAAVWAAQLFETRTARALSASFEAGGAEWVDTEIDGLLVHLSGTAQNEGQRFRALTLAAGVVDAARIIDDMEVADAEPVPAPEFRVDLLRSDYDISLIGLVPASEDRGRLLDRLLAIDAEMVVTDLLDTAAHPAPAGWTAALDLGLASISAMRVARVSITAGEVLVEGLTDSAEHRDDIERRLSEAQTAGVVLTMQLSAPREPITPFTLRFAIDERGARLETCAAETPADRTRILRAARAAGAAANSDCAIGLGAPGPAWPEAATTAIAALADLGTGSVTFADADVALRAPHDVAEEAFDRAVGLLETNLPAGFSLQAHRSAPPAAPVMTEQLVEFVATLSPEGDLQLRGRVPDAAMRTAMGAYARAAFGRVSVTLAARLDPDLPAGWSRRVMAGLEGLSHLNYGLLRLNRDTLELRGTTGDTEAEARITRLLSDRLGPEANVRLAIIYNERLDPIASEPTPERCEAEIAAILAENQITFAPGSTSIEGAAAETLDRIADVMRGCGALRMEIGGHTDSQGREATNLALSQARAEAVIAALMGRRVLVSGLVARGYGPARPIADNRTEEGREANRRIEFRLLPDPAALADGEEPPPEVIVLAPAALETVVSPRRNPSRSDEDSDAGSLAGDETESAAETPDEATEEATGDEGAPADDAAGQQPVEPAEQGASAAGETTTDVETVEDTGADDSTGTGEARPADDTGPTDATGGAEGMADTGAGQPGSQVPEPPDERLVTPEPLGEARSPDTAIPSAAGEEETGPEPETASEPAAGESGLEIRVTTAEDDTPRPPPRPSRD